MANKEMMKDTDSRELDEHRHPEVHYLTPPVDIYENESEILVVTDLPGVEKDALSIELDAQELRVEGRLPAGDGTPHAYRRTFQVGNGIDPEGLSAELKYGVLTLSAKKRDVLKPRRIEVRSD